MSKLIVKVNSDHIRRTLPEKLAAGATDLIERAQHIQRKYLDKALEIESSKLLSDEGRTVELHRAWKAYEQDMARLKKEADGYVANMDQMRDELASRGRGEVSVAEALLTELRAREIRDLLRDQPNADLRAIEAYEEAVENGWDEVADAIEASPVPLANEDLLRKGMIRRMHKANPELAKKIEHLESAHLSVTSTFNDLTVEAMKLSGYQPNIPFTVNGETVYAPEAAELH